MTAGDLPALAASSTLFLFPGQGAYRPGLVGELATASPAAAGVLDRIDERLVATAQRPVQPLVGDSEGPSLGVMAQYHFDTLQFALIGMSLGIAAALAERGVAAPSVAVGHSFGEIAALVAGGAFTVEDAVDVVTARNAALARMRTRRGRMVVVHESIEMARLLCAAAGDAVVACSNTPGVQVVSGHETDLRHLVASADLLGVETTPLSSPFAFHSPMLAPAVRIFGRSLPELPGPVGPTRVWSPIEGGFYDASDDVGRLLARHLVRPVDLTSSLTRLVALGVTDVVECGAPPVLAGAVRVAYPGVAVHALRARPGSLSIALDRMSAGLVGPAVERKAA